MTTALSWNAIMGRFTQRKNSIIFHGETIKDSESEQENSAIGLYICNRRFTEGSISVDVQFS